MARLSTSEIATRTVLVHNTDVPASGQIADYYCGLVGIPTANKLGAAMGTDRVWSYAAGPSTHNEVVFQNLDYLYRAGANSVSTMANTSTGFVYATRLDFSAFPPAFPGLGWFLLETRGSGLTPAQLFIYIYSEASGVRHIAIELAAHGGGDPVIAADVYGWVPSTGTDYTLHISCDTTKSATSFYLDTPANTTTVINLGFNIAADGLLVLRDGILQALTTDYTHTGAQQITFSNDFNGAESLEVYNQGDATFKCWINGVRQKLYIYMESLSSTSVDWSTGSGKKVALNVSMNAPGTPTFNAGQALGYIDGTAPNDKAVSVGFVVFNNAGPNETITDFYNAGDTDLSQFATGGAKQAPVFFGGTQVAADWNAGTNQGTGGTFTMNNSVTDGTAGVPGGPARYPTFWTDLNAKILAVDAVAVFACGGCPPVIGLRDKTSGLGVAGVGVGLASLIGVTKRIIADAGEPKQDGTVSDDIIAVKQSNTAMQIHRGGDPYTDFPTAVENYNDSTYDYIQTTSSTTAPLTFNRFKASFDGDYSALDSLLCGWVGLYTQNEIINPADLYSRSVAILDQARSAVSDFSRAAEKRIMVAIRGLDASIQASCCSLVVERARQMGYKNVDYWLALNATSAATEVFTAASLALGFDDTELTAGEVPLQHLSVALGWGWPNLQTPQSETGPGYIQVLPLVDALWWGGLSGESNWGYNCQYYGGGHSWVGQDVAFNHATVSQSRWQASGWLALLAGYTLAECCFLGKQDTFTAHGDPLYTLHRQWQDIDPTGAYP